MKSNLFLLVVPIVVGLCPATAAAAPSTADQVSMKIDLVAWGESIPGLSLKAGRGGEPVTALAFRYSKPLAYTGPCVLEISQVSGTAPQAAADATAQIPAELLARRKDNPNLVALAHLPGGSKHVTVLLAPAVGGTFLAHVLDDDPTKLPFGRLRIHNLSPDFIALRCNNTTTSKLKPKEAVVVEPKNQEVIYELAYQKEGEWVEQENNLASVKEDEQVQLVVLKSEASFFTSNDGSRSGYLQTVILRRSKTNVGVLAELDTATKTTIEARGKAQEEEAERNARRKPARKP